MLIVKKKLISYCLVISFLFLSLFSFAQTSIIRGTVEDMSANAVSYASVSIINTQITTQSDQLGIYRFKKLKTGSYTISVSNIGYKTLTKTIEVKNNETVVLDFQLMPTINILGVVTVSGIRTISGMGRIDEIHDGIVYSGKKTEVLILDSLDANIAQNNPRQVLGRIPGSNYSETQGSGFPSSGIGFRGLNPTQSIETNTRQNGYNITADIYGYSESYYLTPLEAVERVEVTRGESSLQFGPQFGGVINYITKDGNKNKSFEYSTEQTGGSYGFANSFNSFSGQVGKFNYYSFVQYQATQGWRPNSDYSQITGFGKLSYQANSKLKIDLEYTLMRNRIHMAGGFDDAQYNYKDDTSYRSRNWLESPWNVIAAKLEYKISKNTSLNITSSYLFSARNLVWKNEDGGPGIPDSISTITLQYVNREVEREKMNSLTNEVRLLSNYKLAGMNNTLATGIRIFTGKFLRQEDGVGTTGSDFDLSITGPFGTQETFTTTNIAPFVENIFRVTDKLSVTPGARYEYLHSTIDGYTDETDDGTTVYSNNSKDRSVPLFGIGVQYKTTTSTNIYGNISQAYAPVTYDQLTPIGSVSKIDPNMKDAKGFNSDIGWRGTFGKYLNFDVDAFYLAYDNRIGLEELTDSNGNEYTYRTNIANSVNKGVEAYIEFSPTKLINDNSANNISFFNSFAYDDAEYTTGPYKGNSVEYAPKIINRFGITYARKIFSTTFLISNTSNSFGDASNVVLSSDPVAGLIPSYTVMDWSATCKFKNNYNIKFGLNNLANEKYFTLRTDEYPGPGIIPAIGRSFYLSFGATF